MGLFWDFMKFGLPIGTALGGAMWADKRGMKPIPTALVGLVGWGLGYGVYRAASAATNAVEGLPSKVHVPQVGMAHAKPGVPQIGPAPQPGQQGPLWDKQVGANYTPETRGKDGQPPDQSVVIDMQTRQPVGPLGAGAPPAEEQTQMQPQPYDPGDSFGGGGSQGGP